MPEKPADPVIVYGPEFRYNGEGVGLFSHGIRPCCDGDYDYEPYRGPGHYEMQLALESGATPRCCYSDGDQRVWFDVLECPSYGVLTLARFERKDGDPQ
jgi:hypothetical protein